jgi:hypothetical protein
MLIIEHPLSTAAHPIAANVRLAKGVSSRAPGEAGRRRAIEKPPIAARLRPTATPPPSVLSLA